MSRSKKKTPIAWYTCAKSDKAWKKIWHRQHRRAVKDALHHQRELMPHFREISNVWDSPKDGKFYAGHWVGKRDWFANWDRK